MIESRGDILLTRDPALDQERQNEEIRDLLHENIDLLVLNPVDYREIEPALREAQKAGVPVVVIDSQSQPGFGSVHDCVRQLRCGCALRGAPDEHA